MKSSKRATGNYTNQLKAQYRFLSNTLFEREKTVKKIRTYAKYRLPGYSTNLKRELGGVTKTKKDLANLKIRIRRLQKEGKIRKFL